MDLDPAPNSTPDPTTFFSDFLDAKKKIFIFFSYNLPTGTSSSDFCVKILFFRHYFSPLNTFMRKGNDPDPDPDLYL
jgi:hypothetical protein